MGREGPDSAQGLHLDGRLCQEGSLHTGSLPANREALAIPTPEELGKIGDAFEEPVFRLKEFVRWETKSMNVKILNFRRGPDDRLVAYLDLYVKSWGVILRGFAIIKRDRGPRLVAPRKRYNGKSVRLVDFDLQVFLEVEKAVLNQVAHYHTTEEDSHAKAQDCS
jgi:hypothetical protein